MTVEDLPKDKKIVLFDGICNLCDASVQFIIRHDKNDVFRFVSLQSALGQKIIAHIGIDNQNIDSILLYEPGKAYYYKAQAVFKIIREFGGLYSLLIILSIIPRSIQDSVYDYVAKNRYKWYGRKEECMLPTPSMKAKFLE